MKKLFLTLFMGLFCSVAFTQNSMSIHPSVSNEGFAESTCKYIENKLKAVISSNENWNVSDWSRLVLAVKINPTRQDVTPTAPVKISVEFDVFFSVGDITDNHIFRTEKITMSGIGASEEQAYTAAFKTFSAKNPTINKMLDETRSLVENYYKTHCQQIVQRANMLVNTNSYDEAIFLLTSIPDVCTDCYGKCIDLVSSVYKQKIDYEGNQLLKNARAEWMKGQDKEAASRVAEIVKEIDPNSSAYSDARKLQNTIAGKLNADDKLAWELSEKQMQARHETTLSVIDAARAIGVAWFQNRTHSVINVIRSWF